MNTITADKPGSPGSERAPSDWGPDDDPTNRIAAVAAGLLSAEVLVDLIHGLSLRRFLVVVIVTVLASLAWFAVFAGRPTRWLRSGSARLIAVAVLQCAVVAAFLTGITWWLPLVPALFGSWALEYRARRPGHRASVALRGKAVRTIAAATLIGTGPLFSLGTALAQPSSDPLSIRTVEWLRLRGGEGIVNRTEHWWYASHQPKVGGVPAVPISIDPASVTPATLHTKPNAGPDVPAPRGLPITASTPNSMVSASPAPVRPLVASPVAGEGLWTTVVGSSTHPAIAVTRVRPDPIHTSVVVALARMDPSQVRIELVAGAQDPGGSWPEHGQVPPSERPTLLAAFNSGFRQRESAGGFWINGRQGATLTDGAASLVIRKDGTATVAQWGRDATLTDNVAAVRQNLSLIVDNGAPVAGLDQDNNRKWGRTVGGRLLVWRSGIGVTKDNALVYAGGPGMSIASLANVLTAAGSVRAMELDINSAWVAYFLYSPTATGLQGTKLLPGMRHRPTRYLSSQSRDFFMVVSR